MKRTLEWVQYTDTITCSWQCEWSLCLEHIDFVLNCFNSGSWICLDGPGSRYKTQLLNNVTSFIKVWKEKLPFQTNRDNCLRVDTNTNWKQLWLLAHEVAWGYSILESLSETLGPGRRKGETASYSHFRRPTNPILSPSGEFSPDTQFQISEYPCWSLLHVWFPGIHDSVVVSN